jgi:hypothetical protein
VRDDAWAQETSSNSISHPHLLDMSRRSLRGALRSPLHGMPVSGSVKHAPPRQVPIT